MVCRPSDCFCRCSTSVLRRTAMWLSDAMRIGCAMKPHAFGDFFRDGGSCALGAAQDGFLASCVVLDKAFMKQPWENERCPECHADYEERMKSYTIYALIPHLN